MVEQTHSGECHYHAVLVAALDNDIVTDRSAGLCNVGYAALYKTKTPQKIFCVNVGYADGVAVTKANDTFRFIDILRYGFNDFKLLFSPTPLVCTINGKSAKSLGRIGMTNLVLDGSSCDDAKIGDLVEIPANPIYLSPLIKREYK